MAKEVRTAEKLNGKVKAEKETKKGKQGPAKAASAVQENVTPVRVDGASEQGINIKVKLPVKAKGKAKGKGTSGLKATAATKEAQSVKQQKPALAPPPVKPLHKDHGRSATPALPPIFTFSNNASMGNFVAVAAAAAACTASPVMECQESKQAQSRERTYSKQKTASAPVVPKTAASGEDTADVPKNGTIDDLLPASSIAFDTDSTRVSLEEELGGGRASSSMRDAIQGMLSMSKSVTFRRVTGVDPWAQQHRIFSREAR
ncbi:hypothetical protein HPB49_015089 [Dermacentor silvarum]|uniref:Uncharacterized protein n=1 Tax=Dermacentor silvarum TaxID=543639 RepID=A0ACB8CFU6_DERSI|nr:hypothetical protein HPB49_015089 [Dermacentor silvarum]